ncbi:ankyrin [Trematosphaeria pertusa]|uniref:Ankyrin n=1 Tax=Trematosphaeria pertusa TaxID=390896 RepID=A0A6A6I8U5_9PLEO|nr:ankyrin [Trematosphaeria pertusa]KAF2245950.1 ankyrin [Trematosphaeria pertusa]
MTESSNSPATPGESDATKPHAMDELAKEVESLTIEASPKVEDSQSTGKPPYEDSRQHRFTEFLRLCRAGDHEAVRKQLEGLPNRIHLLRPKDEKGKTALFHAAATQHRDILELLIEKAAEISRGINVTDSLGRTPLMIAAREARLENVLILLEAGADKMIEDHEGRRAIDYASPLWMKTDISPRRNTPMSQLIEGMLRTEIARALRRDEDGATSSESAETSEECEHQRMYVFERSTAKDGATVTSLVVKSKSTAQSDPNQRPPQAILEEKQEISEMKCAHFISGIWMSSSDLGSAKLVVREFTLPSWQSQKCLGFLEMKGVQTWAMSGYRHDGKEHSVLSGCWWTAKAIEIAEDIGFKFGGDERRLACHVEPQLMAWYLSQRGISLAKISALTSPSVARWRPRGIKIWVSHVVCPSCRSFAAHLNFFTWKYHGFEFNLQGISQKRNEERESLWSRTSPMWYHRG